MVQANLSFSELVHNKEKKYFAFILVICILMYLSLFLSVIGIMIFTGLTLVSLFVGAIALATIQINGVRVNSQQFPQVYAKAEKLCAMMEIPLVPDIYVLESSGVLNAFATRFFGFGRNMVILYSSIFELIESGADEELEFIIAHELAHIKRNHIIKQILIMPAMWIPFLGEAYSRACEYTCDRIAAYNIGNSRAAIDSLTVLAIGKVLYSKVNRTEYLKQISSESGFFIWLSEKLSTHPPLPKRIQEIMYLFEDEQARPAERSSGKTVVLWVLVIAIGVGSLIAAGVYGYQTIKNSGFWSEITIGAGVTPLMMATTEGNLDKVRDLIEEGADPNIQDADGWSALLWASDDNRLAIGRELLKAGADPNLSTSYGNTALMNAAYAGNVEFIELLQEFGVNLNQQDEDGWTALMHAAEYGSYGSAKVLLIAGADPLIKDKSNITASDHAQDGGYSEIVDLLDNPPNKGENYGSSEQ